MKLKSYLEAIQTSKTDKDAALAPLHAEETRRRMDLSIAEIDISLLKAENAITSLASTYPLKLTELEQQVDNAKLLARRRTQLVEIRDQLFPGPDMAFDNTIEKAFHHGKPWTNQHRGLLIEMLAHGHTMMNIMHALGRSRTGIEAQLGKMGYSYVLPTKSPSFYEGLYPTVPVWDHARSTLLGDTGYTSDDYKGQPLLPTTPKESPNLLLLLT